MIFYPVFATHKLKRKSYLSYTASGDWTHIQIQTWWSPLQLPFQRFGDLPILKTAKVAHKLSHLYLLNSIDNPSVVNMDIDHSSASLNLRHSKNHHRNMKTSCQPNQQVASNDILCLTEFILVAKSLGIQFLRAKHEGSSIPCYWFSTSSVWRKNRTRLHPKSSLNLNRDWKTVFRQYMYIPHGIGQNLSRILLAKLNFLWGESSPSPNLMQNFGQ